MLRTLICLMTLGLILFVGGCNSSDDPVTTTTTTTTTTTVTIPNLAGTWKMVGNVTFQFDLYLTQVGGTITGKIVRTDATEPEDPVNGTVDENGAVAFTRVRAGLWTQTYVGTVTTSGGITSMSGTFTMTGYTGTYLWQATKI